MQEYELISPITLGEETIKVIKLEEPTCATLKKFNVDLSEEALMLCEGQFRIVCACSQNAHEGHINEMKMRDLVKCSRACLDFFSPGQKGDPD